LSLASVFNNKKLSLKFKQKITNLLPALFR
jgi:hypothetical protein